MFAEERQDEIIRLLTAEGNVKVKDLSSRFGVTEDCIRKDLALLERNGFLKRTYGGAVFARQNIHSFEVGKRKETDIEAKRAIARKALELIHEGDTVFLDISTSNIELAKLLLASEKRVTVVTNMLDIVNIFARRCNVTLISTGGMFNTHHDGFTGGICTEFVSKYKFDSSFIGVVGIDVYENNVTTYDVEDGLTKNAVIKASKKSFLLAEGKKFNLDGNYKYAVLDDFDGIIIDSDPGQEVERRLNEHNVDVI